MISDYYHLMILPFTATAVKPDVSHETQIKRYVVNAEYIFINRDRPDGIQSAMINRLQNISSAVVEQLMREFRSELRRPIERSDN